MNPRYRLHQILEGSLLLALLLCPVGVAAQAVNENGGLESSQVGDSAETGIDSWSFSGWTNGLAEFEIVGSPVQEGGKALKVVVKNVGSNPWDIQAANENVVVEPHTTYTYSVWARSDLDGATANFTVGNYAFSEYGRLDNAEVSLTGEWQEFTFQFTTDAATTIRAPIHFSFDANLQRSNPGPKATITPGVIHVDNLQIYIDDVPTVPPPSTTPLADGHAKFLGNIYSPSQIENFQYYWTQITPENAGKWGSVEATRDVMDWSAMDAAYAFAQTHDLPIRYHVLVWGNQQPGWIDDLSPAEQLAEIEEWFAAVAARYADLEYVEVVNEPMNAPPSYTAALGGNGSTGWDWVVEAFSFARQYFPNSKLMINEYGIISARKGTLRTYKNLVALLQGQGLIDGIGVQGHAFSTDWQAASVMVANLDELASLGLPIQITEMDVDGPTDDEQLAEYQRIFPPFWEHPAVEGITLWGWKPGMWRTAEGAYIVHSNGEERPATPWLRQYLGGGGKGGATTLSGESPTEFLLHGVYPNPFNASATISYALPEEARVTLTVFDALGRQVSQLVDGVQPAGNHDVRFEASNLPSGVYVYRLEAYSEGTRGGVRTGRVALVK